MQRPVHERINSHWVRGCFGEDWEESFRQKDAMKDSALIGVFDHEIVQHHPLRNEWDVRNESLLWREPVGRILDDEEGWVWKTDKPKFRTPYYTRLNWDRIGSALRKYSTITLEMAIQKYSTPGPHPGPNRSSPKQKELQRRRKVKPKRRKKSLAPVTRPKAEISPYAPLTDHLEGYIKKQVKEKKLPQPEVVTATKALIEKRVEEFREQATSLADLEDVKEWRLKMHNALEALLKTGRVHEFIN